MKERSKKILLFSLLLIPIIVFAESDSMSVGLIFPFIFMEAFVSIHMSVFVLNPIAKMIDPINSKKLFWKMFAIRAGILLFFDFFITPYIAVVDFLMVFIGAMAIVPIVTAIYRKKNGNLVQSAASVASSVPTHIVPTTPTGLKLSCAKCGGELQITDKFCAKCGAPFEGDNVVVTQGEGTVTAPVQRQIVKPSEFDPMYILSDDELVKLVIEKELEKAGITNTKSLMPGDAIKRKNILNIIFAALVFVFITLIFFHFPIYTYIVGLIILLVFFIVKNRFDLMKYLIKQVKSRPGEKISNVVMNVKSTLMPNGTTKTFLVYLVIAIVIPLVIFSTPKIIYEKIDGGYGVRYYIFGLTNITSATIPEEHNGEKVISLRGNTFSNMPLLKTVTLPYTVKEIRGQAFYNCFSLETVNLPSNLEYLGGGAFGNTRSLKTVELPNKLTYLGGEAFQNSGISHISLPEGLTEIRGNTFENCTNLRSITIPDSVTRIGGHAFYGDTSLSTVNISANSKLEEIGSSAFRRCYSLYGIKIPSTTSVNSRAFKESPTNIERYGDTLYNFNY